MEIFPVNESEKAVRVEFFGDEVDRITEIDVLTGQIKAELEHIVVFPASHYVVEAEEMERAIRDIEVELEDRIQYFKGEDKLLEAQRISERTNFDIEMMRETGFCSGIENYSRHLAGLKEGETPNTLMNYFPDDYLIMVDESHITIPQIRGMYAGDRSRKETLVNYGFRLRSVANARLILKSLKTILIRCSLCQLHQMFMKKNMSWRELNRLSARQGFWIRRLQCVRWKGRLTI